MTETSEEDFIIRYRSIAEAQADRILESMEEEIAASVNPGSDLMSASAQVDRMKMKIKESLTDEQRFRRIRNGQLLLKKTMPGVLEKEDDLQTIYDELQEAIDSYFNFIPPEDSETLNRLSDETRYKFYDCAYDLIEQNQFNDAADVLLLLTLFCPCVKVYWLARGRAEEESTRLDEAIICYGMATLFDEDDPIPHLFAAGCYARLGQKENATAELDHAETIIDKAEDPETWKQEAGVIRNAIEGL